MKIQHALGALLAVQILLAAGLFAHHRQQQSQLSQSSSILSFDQASVDKVELADKDEKVTLVKSAEGWTLPDYSNLPVDPEKIETLLTDLTDLKGGWPVSTTTDSHETLEVSEKKFVKTIKLLAKDQPVAELFIGTSPGLRTVHLRSSKDENVYAAPLSSSALPLSAEQWFDRGLLKLKEPTEVKGKDYHLTKEAGVWKLDGGEVNQASVDALVQELTRFQVEKLQSTAASGAPSATLEVVDGKPLTFSFWVKDDEVTVRRSDSDKSFTVAKPSYEQLFSYDKAKLTPPKQEAKASPTPTPAATP